MEKITNWFISLSKKDKITYGVILVLIIIIICFSIQGKKNEVKTTDVSNNSVTSTNTNTNTTNTKTVKTVPTVARNVMNKCNFKITSPEINSSVSLPFTVKGVLNKADLSKGCVWKDNLTNGGTVEIFYNKNGMGWVSAGTAAQITLFTTPGVATSTLSFTLPLNLYANALGLGSGTPIKLVFTEFNIPAQQYPDTFDFTVYLK